MSAPIEFTLLTKDGGPLTKQISLAPDGSLHSDGSACIMSRGRARRIRISRLGALAGLNRGSFPQSKLLHSVHCVRISPRKCGLRRSET